MSFITKSRDFKTILDLILDKELSGTCDSKMPQLG